MGRKTPALLLWEALLKFKELFLRACKDGEVKFEISIPKNYPIPDHIEIQELFGALEGFYILLALYPKEGPCEIILHYQMTGERTICATLTKIDGKLDYRPSSYAEAITSIRL